MKSSPLPATDVGSWKSVWFLFSSRRIKKPTTHHSAQKGKKTQEKSQPFPNLQEVFEKVTFMWHRRQFKSETGQLKARFMTALREVMQLQASGIMVLCKEYGSVWGISWKYNNTKKINKHQIDHQILQSGSMLIFTWLSNSPSHSRFIGMFLPSGSCRKSDLQNVFLHCFVLTNRKRLYVALSQDADFPFVMRSLLLQLFLSHCYLIQQFLGVLLWNYKTFSLSFSLCNF